MLNSLLEEIESTTSLNSIQQQSHIVQAQCTQTTTLNFDQYINFRTCITKSQAQEIQEPIIEIQVEQLHETPQIEFPLIIDDLSFQDTEKQGNDIKSYELEQQMTKLRNIMSNLELETQQSQKSRFIK